MAYPKGFLLVSVVAIAPGAGMGARRVFVGAKTLREQVAVHSFGACKAAGLAAFFMVGFALVTIVILIIARALARRF